MIKRVHHMNFIVRDLEAAIAAYERVLNMKVAHTEQLDQRGVITARFALGDTWIVLVQPTRADTIPGRHLEEHGEGFFLMSLEVDSLDSEMDRLGADSFSGPPRSGVEDWRVVDLETRATFGAQLQFMTSADSKTPDV